MAALALDDLKYIHAHDGSGLLQLAEHAPEQLLWDCKVPALEGDFSSVVCTAMGGSASPARLLQAWPESKVPIEVCSSYAVPAYVGKNTFVIAISYSGNTEETLAAVNDARSKGATVAILAGGGKLADFAKRHNLAYIELPVVPQPRLATFYVYKALATLCVAAGLCEAEVIKGVEKLAKKVAKSTPNWRPDVPLQANAAKKIALEIAGTTPVIYADSVFAAAANKWKIAMNENAKNVAWWGTMPEMCHNEFTGWSSHPVSKAYSIIELRSSFELPAIKKRFMLTEKLLSGRRPAAITVQAEGASVEEQLLWLCTFGDHVSIYLGLLNGVDIAGLPLVDKLKMALGS